MTFSEIATPLINLGLPVFPLAPKSKVPPAGMAFLTEATTDAVKIAEWNETNPEFNAAILAGDFCFLEFDQLGIKSASAEMGQPIPQTRMQKSGSGGAHLIFRHTARSRSLGNREASISGKEWFSFRADNRYLVAGGSIHPNGNEYKTVRDVEPIPIPDWLCDWIELHTAAAKPKGEAGQATVSDDFDFEDFADFYDISGHWDGEWFICDECPVAGYRHEQSTRTGFFFDGNSLGFHCFAGGCEGSQMTVGKVIGFLNKKKGEPYKGVIWEQDDSKLFGATMLDDDEPETSRVAVTGPILDADQLVALMNDGDVTVQAVALGETIVGLEMPDDCMYGRLGQLAMDAKVTPGLTYPALIACTSARIVYDKMLGTRINTYVGLIGMPGAGKNVSIDRATQLMKLVPKVDYTKAAPAGDTQLAIILGDKASGKKGAKDRVPGPRRMMLVNNEMTDVLKKTSVENSTLASRLCDSWDENEYEKVVGKETINVNCRLSWLGGLPAGEDYVERFTELFGGETNFGLYPRFIFGYTSQLHTFKDWTPPREETIVRSVDLDDDGVTLPGEDPCFRKSYAFVTGMSPDAEKMFDQWMPEVENRGRLKYNLKKVAILTAAANMEESVTRDCMAAAVRFMVWQIRLREVFKPGVAKNQQAECREDILQAVISRARKSGWVMWKRLAHDRKWGAKYGDYMVAQCVSNLVKAGELIEYKVAKGEEEVFNPNKVLPNPKLYPDFEAVEL